MKNIFFALLFGTILSLFSCDPESSFEQIADVDIPEHEQRLAISANIESGDEQVTALVATSSQIFENESFNVADAEVQLLKDGNVIANLAFDINTSRYIAPLDEAITLEQATYRLEVRHSQFETAFSEQQMPQKVDILGGEYERDRNLGEFDADIIGVEFQDIPNQDNYYLLEAFEIVEQNNGTERFDRIYLYPLFDLSEQAQNGGIIFDDAAFDGNEYRIEAESSRSLRNDAKILLLLKSISRDRYLLERSLDLYRNAEGNPFAEPVVVHDNIEGGYGIFTASAVDTEILEL